MNYVFIRTAIILGAINARLFGFWGGLGTFHGFWGIGCRRADKLRLFLYAGTSAGSRSGLMFQDKLNQVIFAKGCPPSNTELAGNIL